MRFCNLFETNWMKKIFFLSFCILIFVCSYTQNCPPEGDATQASKKELNKKKNKSVNVNSSIEPEELELRKLLPSKQRKNDKTLWREGAYVVMEGYLVDFAEQGAESCNCGEANASDKTGDVHMFLGLAKNSAKKNCMVIEITPKFKDKFPDYENDFLKKKARIRVYGYLFYDFPHEKDAFTTCNACTHIWRKTPWEIHPITMIEVIEDPDE